MRRGGLWPVYIVVSITRTADAGRATERATLPTLTVSLCAELSAGGAARENVVGGAGGRACPENLSVCLSV